MDDEARTKGELIDELRQLRREIGALKSNAQEIPPSWKGQEIFAKAFLENPTPVTITTVNEGRFVDVSDAFLELTGLAKGEIIGQTSADTGLITKEKRDELLKELHHNKRVANVEMRVNTRMGLRHVLVNLSIINIGGQDCLLTVFTDIQRRKEMEEKLRSSEKRFRTIYENTALGIFETTPAGGVLHANRTFARMFGYASPEEVIRTLTDLARQIYVDPGQRAPVVDPVAHGEALQGRSHRLDHPDPLVARAEGIGPPGDPAPDQGELRADAHPGANGPDEGLAGTWLADLHLFQLELTRCAAHQGFRAHERLRSRSR